jgi:hypothetical protein
MFKIPLCIEVIAANEQAEMLEDMGISTTDDPYLDSTFLVCFYKIDAIMPDERSTKQKPLTCLVCGELVYLCKYDMAILVDRIAAVSI